MVIFADTSGLFALLDHNDRNHAAAARFWRQHDYGANVLMTTNYVLVECHSLVQSRLGMRAATAFQGQIAPMLSVVWMDKTSHQRAVETLLAANRRPLSLVDCASFVVMRDRHVEHVFAFDRHFVEQGFILLPEPV